MWSSFTRFVAIGATVSSLLSTVHACEISVEIKKDESPARQPGGTISGWIKQDNKVLCDFGTTIFNKLPYQDWYPHCEQADSAVPSPLLFFRVNYTDDGMDLVVDFVRSTGQRELVQLPQTSRAGDIGTYKDTTDCQQLPPTCNIEKRQSRDRESRLQRRNKVAE